jgi:hypothetical protein
METRTCACCGATVNDRDAYPYVHHIARFKTTLIHKCRDCHHAWRPVPKLSETE